jgi:hypothetical protein
MGRDDFPDNLKIGFSDLTAAISRNDFHAWNYKASETGTQEKYDPLFKKNIPTKSVSEASLPLFIEMIRQKVDVLGCGYSSWMQGLHDFSNF